MEIRGIRGVKRVRGIGPEQAQLSDGDLSARNEQDDEEIEQDECARCGETFDSYALNEQGMCEDCEVEHVWAGLRGLQEQAEQQKRAGLREA